MTPAERDSVTTILLDMVRVYPTAGMKAKARILREVFEQQEQEIARLTARLNEVIQREGTNESQSR